MVKANSVQRRMNKYFLDHILKQDRKVFYSELENGKYFISDGIVSFIDSNLLFNKSYMLSLNKNSILKLLSTLLLKRNTSYADVTTGWNTVKIDNKKYCNISFNDYYVDMKYFQLLYSKDNQIYIPINDLDPLLIMKNDILIGLVMPVKVYK